MTRYSSESSHISRDSTRHSLVSTHSRRSARHNITHRVRQAAPVFVSSSDHSRPLSRSRTFQRRELPRKRQKATSEESLLLLSAIWNPLTQSVANNTIHQRKTPFAKVSSLKRNVGGKVHKDCHRGHLRNAIWEMLSQKCMIYLPLGNTHAINDYRRSIANALLDKWPLTPLNNN